MSSKKLLNGVQDREIELSLYGGNARRFAPNIASKLVRFSKIVRDIHVSNLPNDCSVEMRLERAMR